MTRWPLELGVTEDLRRLMVYDTFFVASFCGHARKTKQPRGLLLVLR
jgi:hypothetical protein